MERLMMKKDQNELEQKSKSKKNGRVRFGKYKIKRHPRGSVTVYGGPSRNGAYIPPIDDLRKKVSSEMRKWGEMSRLTYDYIRNLGYLNLRNQQRSIESGLELLKLDGVKTPLQAKKFRSLKRADKTFRSFWPIGEVHKYIRNPIAHPLQGIKDFRRENGAIYKWIKTNGGMFEFMEERRPGLYRVLSKTTRREAIDLKKLADELRGAVSSGTPISGKYLASSPDPKKRKWFHQVDYAIRCGLIPKNKHPAVKNKTFEQALAYLLNISESEISANIRGVNQLGRLAEKFVAFYLVWASRSGYDPLKLNLPDLSDISLFYEGTEFTYSSKRKGWADARIKNKAVEVKVGAVPIAGISLDELIKKYNSESHWKDNHAVIDGAVFFFHQEPRFYEKVLPELENKGIRVIGFNEFHNALSSLIERVEKKYDNLFEQSYPQVNKKALIEAHENLNLERRLKLFSRPGFETQRRWYSEMLKYLIESGEY